MSKIVSGNLKSTPADIRGRAAQLGLRLDDHKIYVLWKDRPFGGAWLYEVHLDEPEPDEGVNAWLRDVPPPSGLWTSDGGLCVNALARSEQERRQAYEVYLAIQRHKPDSLLLESAVEEEWIRPIEYEIHEFERGRESKGESVVPALLLAVRETAAWSTRHRRNRSGIRQAAARLAALWAEKTGRPADEAEVVSHQKELAELDAVRLLDDDPEECLDMHEMWFKHESQRTLVVSYYVMKDEDGYEIRGVHPVLSL